jgi:hypothetical protein
VRITDIPDEVWVAFATAGVAAILSEYLTPTIEEDCRKGWSNTVRRSKMQSPDIAARTLLFGFQWLARKALNKSRGEKRERIQVLPTIFRQDVDGGWSPRFAALVKSDAKYVDPALNVVLAYLPEDLRHAVDLARTNDFEGPWVEIYEYAAMLRAS